MMWVVMRKTIYILIGAQGSGKTHWARNVLLPQSEAPIVRVSQDEQGNQHRQLFEACIRSGTSVVIDRMNFDLCQRDRFVEPATNAGYHVVFVLFDTRRSVCLSRLANRKDHPTISVDANHNSILDTYYHQFENPKLYEYDEMLTIVEKGRCSILDLRNMCCNNRVIVVGDIHGCFDEFMALLDKCGYSGKELVVATGDLVDRGPKIRETLQWFRNEPLAYSVEGNHDNKYRRYLLGNPVKISNGLDCTLEQCGDLDDVSWEAWFRSLPQIIRLRDVNKKPMYVVHAGVDGRIPIDQQRIETCIYVRNLDGINFLDDKGGSPWWTTLSGDYTIASGHIKSKCIRPNESSYCLDGGAYEDGTLRALVIDNSECFVVEVNCDD